MQGRFIDSANRRAAARDEAKRTGEYYQPEEIRGYVALSEIEDGYTATILAIRHQREDDYH